MNTEKMRIYLIFSFACILNAKADPINNLLSVINANLPKIIEKHDEFSGSVIRSLYNLRDASSEAIFSGPWNATLALSNILAEVAKTIKQKECIASGIVNWKAKVPLINSDLYHCVYSYTKMGDGIRKKLQNAYERGLKIKEDLPKVTDQCLALSIIPNENCIIEKVTKLGDSFKNLLELVRIYNIEAKTFLVKILSEAMYCNAKLLKKVFKMTIDYQEMLGQCLL